MKRFDRIHLTVYMLSCLWFTVANATGNGSGPLSWVWGCFTIITVSRFMYLLWKKYAVASGGSE